MTVGSCTWRQELSIVRVVQRILEGGDGYALRVLECHEGDIAIGLILEHARLCQDLIDFLHCAPAAPKHAIVFQGILRLGLGSVRQSRGACCLLAQGHDINSLCFLKGKKSSSCMQMHCNICFIR